MPWSAAEAVDVMATWLRPSAATLLLVGCRCGPLFMAVPGLGVLGRVVALLGGTLLLAPLLAPAIPAGLFDAGRQLVPLVLRELLIGGTLALAATLPWAVAHSLGTLLDAGRSAGSRGLPPRREAAQLYGALAVALFFALGGARLTLTALAASYELLPLPTPQSVLPALLPGSLPSAAAGLIRLTGQLLWLAIRLALPLLGAQLLADLLITLPTRRRGRHPSTLRSLIGLGVLILGARELFPQFAKLLILWPNLLNQALFTR